MKNNLNQNKEDESLDINFDLEEISDDLTKELEESLLDLQLLEKEKENIGNPDALGQAVLDEVWKQFENQIGFSMTEETLIQKDSREHPETYQEIANSVLQDKRYKDANKEMKEKQKNGELRDEYTGKNLGVGDKANLDHVISRKEIFDNLRRRQAGLSTADIANMEENLKATNEALNKSKGAKSIKEYIEKRAEREKVLREQNERQNKKIDNLPISENEKAKLKEKNNKNLQDKLAADAELMMNVDKNARKAINKKIFKEATKNVGKKAINDALKTIVVSALSTLAKEIINGLIRFFKQKAKSFNIFLSEMRESLKSFFTKISTILKAGTTTLTGTIVSEIFGPISRIFKKISSVIKQGIMSLREAFSYLRDKNNKNKPFSEKVAQIGKIITTGLVGTGALFLGEVFEEILKKISIMQISVPFLGTLANVIGLFLASLISGIIGAIVLNLIDKFIAKRQKKEKNKQLIEKKNDILVIQDKIYQQKEEELKTTKENFKDDILESQRFADEIMKESLEKIFNNESQTKLDNVQEKLNEMEKLLDSLEV